MSLFYLIRGRKFYYLICDVIIIIISYTLSYAIRFYPDLVENLTFLSLKYFYISVPSFVVSYYLFQIYRIMWAYSNINDIYRLILANITGFILFVSSMRILSIHYSRMIIILSFITISVATIFYRILLRDYLLRKQSGADNVGKQSISGKKRIKKRILIVGAGEAGRTFLAEYNKMGFRRQIIGFVDDNRHKVGKIFNGKFIYGTTKEINDIIYKFEVNEVLIAIPSAGAETINRILSIIKSENKSISIKILPSMIEIFDDKPLMTSVRDVSIDDLIGRKELKVDKKLIHDKFSNKVILVTGAGGSIGSEISKQILKFNIKKLVAIGRGEHSIYTLAKELNKYIRYLDYKPDIIYKIADVKDYSLLNRIFDEYKPDVVFHAAAHKHVPLMEFNEAEAIQNNVGGTKNILELSALYKVDEFVLISTDKAVRPVNVMGATKRIAEIITCYYHKEKGLKTSIVRFGNVIGSRGSVIPLFREQIENGGPVTITHPDIMRYFMSIPEASLLVINAAAYSNGGELFVLDMGKQYKLIEIAKRLIELYGYMPEKDIKIEYTGLRPGEKMYEELFYNEENLLRTGNEKIFILNYINENVDKERIEYLLNEEIYNVYKFNSQQIRDKMKSIVNEFDYTNFENDKNKINKMVN